MARRTFLIVDQDGTQVAALKALRDQWTPGEQLTVRGRLYQVVSIVQLEQPDSSGATAMLIVEEPPS